MRAYNKDCGRIRLELNDGGARNHDDFHGLTLTIKDGWNDSSRPIHNVLSVEEARDLRYLLDRLIAIADGQ